MFKVPKKYRIKLDSLNAFCRSDAQNGEFHFPAFTFSGCRFEFIVVASNHSGWEHISISAKDRGRSRIPSWEDMCRFKDLFWDEEDAVVQYHPPKSEYVNVCKFCLHLWRPIEIEIPRPIRKLVFQIYDNKN